MEASMKGIDRELIKKQAQDFWNKLTAKESVTLQWLTDVLADKNDLIEYCKSRAPKDNFFIGRLLVADEARKTEGPAEILSIYEGWENVSKFFLVFCELNEILGEKEIKKYFQRNDLLFEQYKCLFDGSKILNRAENLFKDLYYELNSKCCKVRDIFCGMRMQIKTEEDDDAPASLLFNPASPRVDAEEKSSKDVYTIEIIEQAKMFFETLFAAEKVTHAVLVDALKDKDALLSYCKRRISEEHPFRKKLDSLENFEFHENQHKAIFYFLLVCCGAGEILGEEKMKEFFNGNGFPFYCYKSVFDGSMERLGGYNVYNLLGQLSEPLHEGEKLEVIFDTMNMQAKDSPRKESKCVLQ